MTRKNKSLSKDGKQRLLKLFLKVVGITFGVCVLLIGGIVGAYYGFIYEGKKPATPVENLSQEEQEKEAERALTADLNKTIAVFGVDEDETRTDVIFLVNFNTKTKKVKVLSVPRDTKVEWTDRQRAQLTQYDVYTSKINEMTAYGGMDNIRELTINELENILGVKVDNYVIINIEAFNKIVDAIGGVDVDVPQRMYYNDNEQGLHIDLQPGMQHLDGKAAEGLVRFRKGYAQQDIARIKTQHLFLEAFAKKVKSPSVITKLPTIIPTLFTYVKTDVSLTQITEYLPLLQEFDINNMSFDTLPGEGQMINGVAYFVLDETQIQEKVQETFFDTIEAGKEPSPQPTETATPEPVVDKTVTIEVLNASGIKGAAAQFETKLQNAGYKVQGVGNHSQFLDQSVIKAKDITKAEQFKEFLPNAQLQTDTTISTDIQILLGPEN